MFNFHQRRAAIRLVAVLTLLALIVSSVPVGAQDAPPTPPVAVDASAGSHPLYLPLVEQAPDAANPAPADQAPPDDGADEFTSQAVTEPLELELAAGAAAQTPAEFEAALATFAASDAAPQEVPDAAVMFDSIVAMPMDVQLALSQGFLHSADALGHNTPMVISTYRREGNWLQAVVVPKYIVDAGWEIEFSDTELVEVLAWRAPSGRYYSYAQGSAGFDLLAAAVPGVFADYSIDAAIDSAAATAEDYLFPWTKDQQWFKNGGWHPGSGWASGDAIDFQPKASSGNYTVNYAVLAPISGKFNRICGPDPVGQSAVRIVNSSVGTTKILHIDDTSIPSTLLDQQVVRGQYLGHSHLTYKPEEKNYKCGWGAARHIHVAPPNKTMKINGYVADDVAKATSGRLYTSTNTRVDNHLAKVTIAKAWTNDGGSNWNTVKTSFRPGDAIRYTAAVNNNTSGALSVAFVFEANGPSGRIAYYSGTHSTGNGTLNWGLGSTIPANAASGAYTFRVTVTYNGASHSQSSTFTVQGIDCTGKYKAEYYKNRDLSGSPTYIACEGWPILHDWGSGGPGNGIGNDDFSARWSGTASFTAGRYRFIAEADDGVRVWLDGTQIINEWRDQGTTTFRHERDVSTGNHQIRVEYYEHGGGAVARFRWEQISSGGSGNIARGRPAYASSQESSSYPPSNANDGNTGTRWSSRVSTSLGTQWWYVDLGGKSYDKVRIKWENAYPATHFIGWSNDCSNYYGYDFSISAPGTYTYNIGSHSEKCVAIFMYTRAPRMNNYSIWEVEVAQGSFVASAGSSEDEGADGEYEEIVMPIGEGANSLQVKTGDSLYLPLVNN